MLDEGFSHLMFCPRQIPHLAEGVRIHGEKVTEALRPFHDRLEACFKQLREKVEKQYGAKSLVRAFCLLVTFLLHEKCFSAQCGHFQQAPMESAAIMSSGEFRNPFAHPCS